MTSEAREIFRGHVDRLGLGKARHTDAPTHYQIALIENFLEILQAAMDDEGVHPETARRIIEKFMWGTTPNRAEIVLRQELEAELLEKLKTGPLPPMFGPGWKPNA